MPAINRAETLEAIAVPTNRLPHVSFSGARASQAKTAAMAFAKQAACTNSLESPCFILTNDSRSVIFFDRCSLVVHYGGTSEVSAASNEPLLDKKSEFAEASADLSQSLKNQHKPVLMAKDSSHSPAHETGLSSDCFEQGLLFLQNAGAERLLIVPLVCSGTPIGHLLMEFFDKPPEDEQISALLDVTPFLALSLLEKIILQKHPDVRKALAARPKTLLERLDRKRSVGILMIAALALCFLFVVPIPFSVGGEAEVVPETNQFAFCGTEGTVREVFVREGDFVEEGTLLAKLDSKELDFQITGWTNQSKILAHEMHRLTVEAGEKPALLAEKRIVELKHEAAVAELDYLNWRTRQLEVRSPTSGIVVTREVGASVGRKFRAGEQFAEIADPRRLQATVYVPENRAAAVKTGMPVEIYLNNAPTTAHHLTVDGVSPMVENMPRLGNVFRVTAEVPADLGVKMGMKGIGRIQTGTLSLYAILENRLGMVWNQLPFLL